MNKGYWMWHYGDYEIYHTMNVHLRRESRGYHVPPCWKVSSPYVSVRFRKEVISDGGYMICHMKGAGYVLMDDKKRYDPASKIEIAPGTHLIEVIVSNLGGLPALFVESDVCPSDGSWTCNHCAGEFAPVGYKPYFDSPDKNPEIFPFEYERKLPVSKETIDGGVLYDFGTELFGYLNVDGADENEKIGVFYGESREEALDTENTHTTDSIFGKSSYKLRQRAFRYVYLTGNADGLCVSCDYEFLPLRAVGDFTCDNDIFNKIYDVAKYTFHLNCREGFLDGIKRDRWIWSGDAYQSARINRYLFADKEIEERTLIGLVGRKPIEQHINTILDYSLLWIITLDEHYMTYADKEFLRRIYPMACELLSFVETRLNSDGFIEGIPGDWTFIDWSDIDKCGAVAAEQMLLIESYRAMARITQAIGESGAHELLIKAESLKSRVNEYYWSEELGAFIDSYSSGRRNVTRHANIFAVLYGISTEEQTESILERVLKNDSITKITTPYFEGYELDALLKLGEFGTVEKMLDSYWGGMIRLGATTVWEEYDPTMKGVEHYAMYGGKYEKSLCHAWGAGPIYLFGRYYLGVYATAPGYETFEVAPTLGGLGEISGSVPVGDGTVYVKLNKESLSVRADRAGGTLIWKGERFKLVPDETITLPA